MEEKKSIIQRILGAIKTMLFEKGRLVYLINIRSFRKSRKQIETKPRKEKIRIGFMIQCPTNWTVLEPVYQAALEDNTIEPLVLLIPEMDFAFYIKLKRVLWEDTYAFGQELFGDQAVRSYNPETGTWIDPKTLELDYVFVPRPYETYLPKAYRASSLRKISKVCYVPYGFPAMNDWQISYNSHFIRNVYMLFCECDNSERYLCKMLSPTVKSGDQKVLRCGYPKLDGIEKHEGKESTLWPRKRDDAVFRIMWTPRWTTDPRLGGSNFFTYKDQMISWAEEDESIDLLFRPHPLALQHYVETGLMSEEEQRMYLERYKKCPNTIVDQTRDYFDTFFSSDCLITDISSMIMEYLYTGKPVVYCSSPEDNNISIPELLQCLYVVKSFDEIQETVAQLREGNDPKKVMREQLARKLKPGNTTASLLILREIKKDCYSA